MGGILCSTTLNSPTQFISQRTQLSVNGQVQKGSARVCNSDDHFGRVLDVLRDPSARVLGAPKRAQWARSDFATARKNVVVTRRVFRGLEQ